MHRLSFLCQVLLSLVLTALVVTCGIYWDLSIWGTLVLASAVFASAEAVLCFLLRRRDRLDED